MITTLASQVGEKKMVPNIGLLEILGGHIGVKMAPLDLLEELIISTFKELARGLSQKTLGLMTLEMKLN